MTTTYGPSNDTIPEDELDLAATIARVEGANLTFAAATPAQQRVLIAEDVLLWLKTGKVDAMQGIYLRVLDDDRVRYDLAKVNGFTCEACALGAIFACALERDQLPRSGDPDDDGTAVSERTMRRRLEPYFSEAQLKAIEGAFEINDAYAGWGPRNYGYALYKVSKSAEYRMEAIMRNIIANDGSFVYDEASAPVY